VRPADRPADDAIARVPRRARVAAWCASILGLLFVGATFVIPLVEPVWPWARVARVVWAPLCHQIAGRCLTIGPGPQAVCARCSGLYLGCVAGMMLASAWLMGRRAPRASWMLWAALPSVVDFLLPFVGLPQLSNVPRLLLAVPPGVFAGIFLALGVGELFGAAVRPAASPTPAVVRPAHESP